jgi:signal transduction histidine kinase
VTFLQDVLLVAFLGLAALAALQWGRRRSRPAAYLTVAFGSIGFVLLAGRLELSGPDGFGRVVTTATVVVLALFPWLLAAFSWSFVPPLPRWLRLAGIGVVALGIWGAVLSPFPDPAERTTVEESFVLVFIAAWGVLAFAGAVRLWTAGGRQRLVRSRMRLMAAGMVAFTVALFISVGGAGSGQRETVQLVARLFLLASAGMFVAGFSPPLPLRLWWRRRSAQQFQRMQLALIGAATPREVGAAVVPMLAELLGSGVVLVGPDHEVLAEAQVPPQDARVMARRLTAGGTLDDDTLVVPVDSSYLLVRSNPYTPVFGQDEQELVTAFSLQVRLALERSELFEENLAARAEAERSGKELEAMIFGLSHDLRSPAVAISGFATLLREVEDPDTRAEMIGRIQASTDYLNDLVDSLLELGRIGRAQDAVEPVDLARVARLVGQRLEANHPSVTVELDERLPVVLLDPARAEQLLDNLVSNAVKHGGREDLTIRIGARRTADGVEVRVTDDGRGVSDEDRDVIFALFQRGSNAGGRGSGLGLGMVRRIAETCGGSVVLEQDGGQAGATFVITLPEEVVVEPRPAPSV